MCKKNEKKLRLIYVKISVVCLIVLFASLARIADYYWKQFSAEWSYSQMKQEYEIPVVRIVQSDDKELQNLEERKVDFSIRKENQINFTELHEQNADIYAWIEIPGTEVNYPVLQHPTDDQYYLNHTVDLVSGLPGSIYSESIYKKNFSDIQTVLYGHNMKNGSMFGSLHKYEDEHFFYENPYIYIYLENKTLIYRIFAAVKFADVYLSTYCNYEEKEGFCKYLKEVKTSPGNVNEDVDVSFGNRILTLSTCIAKDAYHRFLVEAVLVDEYE